jgi:hypothetical protein
VREIADKLKTIISETEPKLRRMDDDEVILKPYPEKWSKKELLGHLIDSAANNHQRFVRSQYGVAKDFPPYAHNEWVSIQKYNEIDWETLISFWLVYNQHLIKLIENIPAQFESTLCNIGKDEPVTLKFVVEDYLQHMQHHLDDILNS